VIVVPLLGVLSAAAGIGLVRTAGTRIGGLRKLAATAAIVLNVTIIAAGVAVFTGSDSSGAAALRLGEIVVFLVPTLAAIAALRSAWTHRR